MAVDQFVAKDLLSEVMIPGKRYFVKELQLLFSSNYEEWEDADFDTDNAIGEAWEMHVKNCVRLSPCRPPENMNSWPELNCERVGRRFAYWLEGSAEQDKGSREALPRITERKRPKPNDGWNAEQFVKRDLEDRGFKVIDVSGGGFGCDLIAIKDERSLRIEVKSSIGPCSPTLTDSEWQTATRFGDDYILAILDNFEPEGGGDEPIHYLPNPTSLDSPNKVRHYSTTHHVIHRHTWAKEIGLSNLSSGPLQHGVNECMRSHDPSMEFLSFNTEEYSIDVLMACNDEVCERKWMTTVRLEESAETNEEACLNRTEGYCVLGSAERNEYDIEAFCSKCGYSIWFGYVGNAYWQRVR